MRRRFIITMLISLIYIMGTAQIKYARVVISVPKSQVKFLYQSDLGIDHGYYDDMPGTFTTTIHSADTLLLRQLGYRFTVTTDDETAWFQQNNDPADFYRYSINPAQVPSAGNRLLYNAPAQAIGTLIATPAAFSNGSMGGYYTLAELKQKLDNMVAAYPSLVKIDTIGYTFENRPLWMVKLSDNVKTDEPEAEMLYTGLHHAREPNSMMNLVFFMQYLLENYASNARIAELINSRQLFFIPCMNPDGYEYNRIMNPSGGGLHRKNRSNTGSTNGVDLNRNYTPGWGYDNTGSSPTPSSDTYRGTAAFSEKETTALRDWLRNRKVTFTLNHHTYGGTFVIPPSCPCLSVTAAENSALRYIGAANARYNFYIVGTDPETVGYSTNGVTEDFLLAGDAGFRGKILGATPESGTAFWPAASQIIPTCKDLFYGNLQSALFAGSYTKVEDRNSIAVNALSGSFGFTAQRIGLLDSPTRVALIPLENIATVGTPVTINSMTNYLDTINGAVAYTLSAGIQSGQRIRYVWSAVTAGITVLDTVTCFYTPTILFTDNMEGSSVSAKWTVSSGWNYTTTAAYSGAKSLAESPSGNYTANAALTATCNTTLDLSNATNAMMSFRLRHNSQNGYDKLQVQTSPNGSTYTAAAGSNTVAESKGTIGGLPAYTGLQNTWSKEVINLSGLLGNPAARVRFQFTSDAATQADGFYIDDVEIIKTTSAPLPARKLVLSGSQQSAAMRLTWDGELDVHHAHFIVERSVDGANFTGITPGLTGAVFAYTDVQPFAGMSFYRIRQVDRDGQYMYSNVIKVVYHKGFTLVVAPVPAKDFLTIRWKGAVTGAMEINITDALGRLVHYRLVDAGAEGYYRLPVAGYAKGLYHVAVGTASAVTLTAVSFIKE